MQRKIWIDNLRGFCMLAILLDHTEIYYAGNNVIDYNFYVVNALVIFFILSGYLMYKPSQFSIRHKLYSVFRSLFVPYLVFTSLISIPKAIVHGNNIDFYHIAIDIITGQASWFVAALCVAELIFSSVIWIAKGKNIGILTCGIGGLLISIYLSTGNQSYFWQLDNALQALFFLSLGFLYHRYESHFNIINKRLYICLLFILLIGIKIYEYNQHFDLLIWHIHITNYAIFLLDIVVGSLLMIQLFKTIPPIKWLSWTGSHSIVYYFLCGGVPLTISKILMKIDFNYEGNYFQIIVAFMLVYLITSIITYIIYQYIPFIVGKKHG